VRASLSRWSPPSRRHAAVIHALVVVVLFAWAFAVFDAARPQVSLYPDEEGWISAGRYFGYFFLARDPNHPAWRRGNRTLTQPPGFRYVLGAGLWLQGHDLEALNPRGGGRPTNAVLMDARLVAVLFGAGVVALLYVVGVQLGAPPAGAVAALLAGASPYLREHFVHAMAESTFAFFLLAALALCLATFRPPAGGFGLGSGILAGSALGLALATKLTAILSLPALALACAGAAFGTRARGERRAWWRPLTWGPVVGLTCWGLFIAAYPFLWPDPPGRTLAMFQFREAQMRRQQNVWPEWAVHDPRDRLALVLGHTLIHRTWANTTLGFPLDVPLAALGLGSLGAIARRDWCTGRRIGPATFLVGWLLSYLIGIAWGYGMNWDRYVVPLFLLATLLSGLGVRELVSWGVRVGGFRLRWSPIPNR
jgi:hypothetical protein